MRDFWRGYSDRDMVSVMQKMGKWARPGVLIPVTKGEWNALMKTYEMKK